jgi:hypothetical protein
MTAPDRAAMVAAIRALADFVEQRTDLPVPTSVRAQHSLITVDPQNIDRVREVADLLGVEANVYDITAMAEHTIAPFPTSVVYAVHGFHAEQGGQR